MRVRYLPALFSALLASMFQIANSAPIKFEHWGVATGSIGSTSFVNQEFKVTAFGDTVNLSFTLYPAPEPYPDKDIYSIDHDSASIVISGVGEFALSSATRTQYSSAFVAVGWARAGDQGDIFSGPFNLPALESWDMTTTFDELSGIGVVTESLELPAIMTTGGQLKFVGEYGVVAGFRATVIPEPNCFRLAAMLGVASFAPFRRRRR
jgi:hypothetical protein